jgi:hypothetical protein
VTTIFLAATPGRNCQGADHVISSQQPEALLKVVRDAFGDPRTLDGRD